MTSGTLNAPRAVRHSIVQPTGKLMLGMLLSSISTGAFAQGAQPANPPVVTVAPGSTTARVPSRPPRPTPAQPAGPASRRCRPPADRVDRRRKRSSSAAGHRLRSRRDHRHRHQARDQPSEDTDRDKRRQRSGADGPPCEQPPCARRRLDPSLRVATFEARQSALTVGIRGIVPFDAEPDRS